MYNTTRKSSCCSITHAMLYPCLSSVTRDPGHLAAKNAPLASFGPGVQRQRHRGQTVSATCCGRCCFRQRRWRWRCCRRLDSVKTAGLVQQGRAIVSLVSLGFYVTQESGKTADKSNKDVFGGWCVSVEREILPKMSCLT